jgi:hypothetical protein
MPKKKPKPGRPKLPIAKRKVAVTFILPPETVRKIDSARGKMSRGQWLDGIVQVHRVCVIHSRGDQPHN